MIGRQLIKDCKANLRNAQEELYKQFYGGMLKLCCRYLKSDDLAKEAVNAGFLKVFQHIAKFDEARGDLQVWIKTIMVRTCIDLRRKELKFYTSGLIEEAEDYFVSPSVLEKLYAEDLLKSIRHLPQATQLVFNLSVIDGYNHKEIADQLEIGEATSRWHLSEAKRKLRQILLKLDAIRIENTTEKGGSTT